MLVVVAKVLAALGDDVEIVLQPLTEKVGAS